MTHGEILRGANGCDGLASRIDCPALNEFDEIELNPGSVVASFYKESMGYVQGKFGPLTHLST